MKLANYISDLLYRYECVIVPGFGGFVTNNKSAKINFKNNTLLPPYKQITFNSHLVNNDGLLANYIASIDKISYNCALNYIQFEIESWNKKLKVQELILDMIGSFTLINNKLLFEPQYKVNYLTESFGLGNVLCQEIKRETYKEQVVKLEEKAPLIISHERRNAPSYLKYAAIFVLGISVVGFGNKFYKNYQNKQMVISAKKQQEVLEQKIENATFVITKPLPALDLNVIRQKLNFHVIAGAFRIPENANRKVEQLKKDGYDARILGVNKWNLNVVSFGSFASRDEAYKSLSTYKNKVDQDAWLLIQEF